MVTKGHFDGYMLFMDKDRPCERWMIFIILNTL